MKKIEIYEVEAREIEALSERLSKELETPISDAQVIEALITACKYMEVNLAEYV